MSCEEPEIRDEILAHLAANPESEDTLEGIAEWWIFERCISRRTAELRATLAELVASGLIEERGAAGLERRYRINRDRLEEIRALTRGDT